jgi:acetyltransferase-like isoleucine patch superfamily enzyme
MKRLFKKKFLYFDNTAEVRPGAYIVGCSKISLGRRCVIRPGCMLHGASENLIESIDIEDDVMLGSGGHIYVSNHTFSNFTTPIIDQGQDFSKPVVIKKGAWLDANIIVMPGSIIGGNTVVGAGAVVTKSLPPRVLAAGVPARIIKSL